MKFNILYGKHENLNSFPLQEGNLYITDDGCMYLDTVQNNSLIRLRIMDKGDWSANKNQEGYILNRTHWYGKQRETLIKETLEKQFSETFYLYYSDPNSQEDNSIKFIPESEYAVAIDNQEYIVTAYSFVDEHGETYNCLGNINKGNFNTNENEYSEDVPFLITQKQYSIDVNEIRETFQNDICIITDNPNSIVKIEKLLDTTGFVQLPEEYIPDSIARIAALPKGNWQENDENSPNYIQNRTHYYGLQLTKVIETDSINGGDFIEVGYGYHGGTFEWDNTPANCAVGDYWIIDFNGKRYKCKSYMIDDYMYCLGDSRIVDEDTNPEDVPFYLEWTCDDTGTGMEYSAIWTFLTKENEGLAHSLTLYHQSNSEYGYNQLDIKYIPDANWEARKGQPGHIQNRTHYKEYELRYVFKDIDPHKSFTGAVKDSDYYDPNLSWQENQEIWSDALRNETGIPQKSVVILDGVWYENLPIWSHTDDAGDYVTCIGDSRLTLTPVYDEEGNMMMDENYNFICEPDMSYPADVPFAIECYEYDNQIGTIWYSDYYIHCNNKYATISLGTATTLKYYPLDKGYIPDEVAFKNYITEAVDKAIGGKY